MNRTQTTLTNVRRRGKSTGGDDQKAGGNSLMKKFLRVKDKIAREAAEPKISIIDRTSMKAQGQLMALSRYNEREKMKRLILERG